MKVVIVNAYGRSNRGDSVLLDECISEIREALPEAEVACALFEGISAARAVHPNVAWSERIGNSKGGFQGRLVTLLYMLSAWAALLPGLGFLAALLPLGQRATLKAIREADYVISAPGGYIHDTNFAYYVALLHIHLGTVAGAKVILAPQSVGPIDSGFARRVARSVLSSVPVICARESYSYNFLTNDLGLTSDIVKRAGDSAFWNDHVLSDLEAIDVGWREAGFPNAEGRPILGLTVVNWSFPKAADPRAARADYVREMAKIIDYSVTEFGMVPVVFNQVSDDDIIAREIAAAAASKVHIDAISREPDILRAFIARSTVFVGTRFHSCIFAMMAGRPTTAIAYLPKTSYILQDLGLSHRQEPIEAMTANEIIARIRTDIANLSAAETEIQTAVVRYRKNFTRLRDYLEQSQGIGAE